MPETNFINWVNKAFSSMSIGEEDFFVELWENDRLSYANSANLIDLIDENNAKLLCTALEKRQPSLIILPDDRPHRGALMFATALLKCAVECIEQTKENQKVLYLGTSIGFKYALSKTSIGRVALDTVFNYTQSSGKYNKHKTYRNADATTQFLPEVICVYHPTNPEEFVQIYKPDWVAVDCSGDIEVDWLKSLLTYCQKKGKPIVVWGQNNFSNIIDLLNQCNGKIYFSPKTSKHETQQNIGELFVNIEQRTVEPIIFSKETVGSVDENFLKAKTILKDLSSESLPPLKRDALRICWTYLRTVERLTIPVEIFNAEAKSFRFIYSFDALSNTLDRYIGLLSSEGKFISKLEEFKIRIKEIIDNFSTSFPPYWSVLSDYCTDRPPAGFLRALIFPKRHQKQIFSYTLLSKFNINEDELLNDSRIILRTLKELLNPGNTDKELFGKYNLILIIAGLPDYSNRHLFYRIINQWMAKLLIYPHQMGILKTILDDFNRKENLQLNKSIATLKELTNSSSVSVPRSNERYLFSKDILEVHIKKEKSGIVEVRKSDTLLNIGDLHSELSRLFESGERDEEEEEYLLNVNIAKGGENDKKDLSAIIEDVIEIQFHDGFRLLVDPKEKISVIRNGEVDDIYVRAVKENDKVILVENQAKQSLYDLIISRIHNHPSLEIHLAMLKKWKEEFYRGYTLWKKANEEKELDDFLILLQEKGCEITHWVTIHSWLNGYTLRPQDEKDIKRIGEVLDIKFLRENYERIHSAASRIVGIHIRLSRKLNDWIENKAGDFHKQDTHLIDEELGLTFGELRSSIKILKVKSSTQIRKPILRNYLGRLEKIN